MPSRPKKKKEQNFTPIDAPQSKVPGEDLQSKLPPNQSKEDPAVLDRAKGGSGGGQSKEDPKVLEEAKRQQSIADPRQIEEALSTSARRDVEFAQLDQFINTNRTQSPESLSLADFGIIEGQKSDGVIDKALTALSVVPAGRGVKVAGGLLKTPFDDQAANALQALRKSNLKRSKYNKIGTSGRSPRSPPGAVAANPSTKGKISQAANNLVNSVTWRVVGAVAVATFIGNQIIEMTIGQHNFGEFVGMEEASQSLSIPLREAYNNENWEVFNQLTQAQEEVFAKNDFWENAQSYTPIGTTTDLEKYREAGVVTLEAWKELAQEKQNQNATGQSDSDYWKQRDREIIAREKEIIDYFNEQRKLTEEYIQRLRSRRGAGVELPAGIRVPDEFSKKNQERTIKNYREYNARYRKLWTESQKSSNTNLSNLSYGLI